MGEEIESSVCLGEWRSLRESRGGGLVGRVFYVFCAVCIRVWISVWMAQFLVELQGRFKAFDELSWPDDELAKILS
ncbi:pentatricopeptide repeat-containing protein [Corchorus olitorius]|uniref:Pentatricopeptide repeat-containing protein n=1 Tax=Corchorus olitorius TaxID=93759 RepID=A0A1R3KJ11_9ROSI|nr:pentatricopeptide repeat-containing protein [Corchorus olitorius]